MTIVIIIKVEKTSIGYDGVAGMRLVIILFEYT